MILQADARSIPLADACVQTVVTSPPYWGLRDYQTGQWQGGNVDCSHSVPATGSTQNKGNNARLGTPFRERCGICGATRRDLQIGLEPTPELYVETMVQVFREVRRVLRDDGTVWLNLGDSYAGSMKGCNGDGTKAREIGLKPKDLCGIPWRVAFALQADGWYLRSDIIWAKPNPMPESVTDRPTRSHEYLFLLSKSERYFYDADAIREPQKEFIEYQPGPRASVVAGNSLNGGFAHKEGGFNATREARGIAYNPLGRNRRDVWEIPSEPTPEAHFATFPQKLIEPCILAGSRPGDLIFDPFLGSGTTGKVAERLGRKWVGLELSSDYVMIARNRTAQIGLGL